MEKTSAMCLSVVLALTLSWVGVEGQLSATCVMVAGSGVGNVSGTIHLYQPSNTSNVTVSINLAGFNLSGVPQHGFHVHQNASLANSCDGAGLHYNLDNTLHGAPWNPENRRHTGDLGNIPVANGVSNTIISDWLISLSGPRSVIGLPFVVHSGTDDLGLGDSPLSNITGNAGSRLGCCLITLDAVVNPILTGSMASTPQAPPGGQVIFPQQNSASLISSLPWLMLAALIMQFFH